MSTIANSMLGLADFYAGTENDGSVSHLINMMAQSNAIFEDVMALPASNGSTHKTTMVSTLPNTATWGRLNKGAPLDKLGRTPITDVTAFINKRSTVDVRSGNIIGKDALKMFRLQEAQGIIEGMSQAMSSSWFYSNADANPDAITGLAPRYGDLSAENGKQIIDAGGTGSDNTSLWMLTWGQDAIHTIHPKDSTAGIHHEDMGKQRVTDENGDAYYAYEDMFDFHSGIVVRDWTKAVRIANIDVSAMEAGSVDLFKFMRKGYSQLRGIRSADRGTAVPGAGLDGNFGMGRSAIYCNKEVLLALEEQSLNAGGSDNYVRLKPMELEGKEVDSFKKLPIRQVDALVNTEARVV